MCGILGSLPAVDEAAFHGALNNLSHRGPDGTGTWRDDAGRIGLGHQRLSIIDLSTDAAQPMHYGRYVLVFNGEIYNYKELRQELANLGHKFSTTSDSEVLVAAYAQWGRHCLSRLNGMWAFAIWDKEENTLFFSRDRFGEKPFFYSHSNDRFVFASEMKGLAPLLERVEVSDKFAWMQGHLVDYEATEETLLQGVKRLLPGHYGEYRNGQLTIERYYNLLDGAQERKGTYEDHVVEMRQLLMDSIALRLRADVPVGCALSGGLDSSAVLAGIHQQYNKVPMVAPPRAFTAHFPGAAIDELRYAQSLTQSYNLPLEKVQVDGEAALQQLPDDLYYFEELYRNAPSPMMQLYRRYREAGVYVSLDGHGPDELFSGYGNFIFLALLDAGINRADWEMVWDTYQGMFPQGHGQFKNKDVGLLSVLKTKAWQVWDDMKGFRSEQEQAIHAQYNIQLKNMGHLNAGLFRLFNFTTFPTLLRNYDRYAMRSGVEVRMPFTDHRLVEFCFSLGWKDKLHGGYTKKILRDAMAPFLPDDIVWRKEKVGFQSPLAEWLQGPWKEWLEDTLHSTSFNSSAFANGDAAIKTYRQFTALEKPDLESANAVWQQLMPYLWEQHFFNRIKQQV